MISKVVVFHCRECKNTNVVKNGKNSSGSQQFLCKDCRKSAVMYPQNQRTMNDQVCAESLERFIFSRDTLKKLLKKSERTTDNQGKFVAS
jgi:ribosomal protein S27E